MRSAVQPASAKREEVHYEGRQQPVGSSSCFFWVLLSLPYPFLSLRSPPSSSIGLGKWCVITMGNGEITLNPKPKSAENILVGKSLVVRLRGGGANEVISNLLMTCRANFPYFLFWRVFAY